MRKIVPGLSLYLLTTLLWLNYACSPEPTGNNQIINEGQESDGIGNNDTLNINQGVVYTVPTPYQVASLLKILNIDYSEDIISGTLNKTPVNATIIYKALFLGINMVDLSYTNIYEQRQTSIFYMSQLKDLLSDLGYNSEREVKAIQRIETYKQNKDSVNQIISEFQEYFDNKFSSKEDRKVGLLVLSGIYIEGTHIALEIYDNLIVTKAMTTIFRKNLNQLIFQQQIFIENLLNIMKQYNTGDMDWLIAKFSAIHAEFEKMDITYEKNSENKIVNVNIRKDNLPQIKSLITGLRSSIVQ